MFNFNQIMRSGHCIEKWPKARSTKLKAKPHSNPAWLLSLKRLEGGDKEYETLELQL